MIRKIRDNVGAIGAVMFLIGSSGMAEAVEGRGSFFAAAIVFSVGLGLAWAGFRGEDI